MNSQLLSFSPCLSLVCFLLVILLNIQSSSCNRYLESLICPPQFQCGNFTANYPFSGPGWDPCGHPQFKLDCEGDRHDLTTMMINYVKYKVIEINPKTQTLRIARMLEYLEGICPEFPNTTFDFILFKYSDAIENENVTLNYNCPPSPPDKGKTNCRIIGIEYKDGHVEAEGIKHEQTGCNANVSVPVPRPLLVVRKSNWSDWQDVLQQGFELKWSRLRGMACEDCTSSKGICGFDDTYSHETICYCPHISNSSFFHGPCPENRKKEERRINKKRRRRRRKKKKKFRQRRNIIR